MSISRSAVAIRRRTLFKAGLAVGALQVASPFVLRARRRRREDWPRQSAGDGSFTLQIAQVARHVVANRHT